MAVADAGIRFSGTGVVAGKATVHDYYAMHVFSLQRIPEQIGNFLVYQIAGIRAAVHANDGLVLEFGFMPLECLRCLNRRAMATII